ncbi:hypothetical protein CP49_01930 [Bradyrhizobium valentinum]|uniref:Uncharacterized protein n=1 Tax=Bradyrhizobium valentinum TaxID=1518501 RepID=A0A0R3LMA0_9BRAD|nr:hypothetical protein CP49_01930 [Bradyrhizobium valentinum]
MAPVSGAIFIAANQLLRTAHLRQIGQCGKRKQKPFALWHIIYKNAQNAHTKKYERILGGWPCSPQGTAKSDVAEDGQCMHASLFLRIAI